MAKRPKKVSRTQRKEKSHATRRGKAAHVKAETQFPQVAPPAAQSPSAGGRPTDFRPEYIVQARKLAALGAIDREIADFFETDERTFRRWKLAHPELAASLKAGKEVADDRVERSLYQNAVGYRYQAEKPFVDKDGGEHVIEYTEVAKPDTTAQIFFLKNRRPDQWRDRQQIDLNITTAEGLAAARQRVLDSRVVSEQTPNQAA